MPLWRMGSRGTDPLILNFDIFHARVTLSYEKKIFGAHSVERDGIAGLGTWQRNAKPLTHAVNGTG